MSTRLTSDRAPRGTVPPGTEEPPIDDPLPRATRLGAVRRRLFRPGADRKRLSNVFSLARGTVLAQLVFVIATPILTRIYSAEEMGVFGVLVAIVMIVSQLAGLRYELAVPLPRRDEVALHLVWLTLMLSAGFMALAYVAYAVVTGGFGLFAGAHPLQSYPIIVVAGVVMFVFNEALAFWFIRTKAFPTVANARVINSVSLALMQLGGFFTSMKLLVLLGAYPIALTISSLYMLRALGRSAVRVGRARFRLYRTLIGRYREFPLYSTWSSSMFELSQALPLFVLATFFDNRQAGFFFLARRIGLIPTSVIGRAISQVNHAEMLEHRRSGALAGVLLKQIHFLQWLSVVPAAVLAWFAPAICERLLGADWRIAGEYLQLMTPYVVVRLSFSPMLAINHVAEWQREGFHMELLSTLLSSAALLWYALHGDAYDAVAGYFGVLCVANLAYRTFLMHRLGVGPLTVLKPLLSQGAALLAVGAIVLSL